MVKLLLRQVPCPSDLSAKLSHSSLLERDVMDDFISLSLNS